MPTLARTVPALPSEPSGVQFMLRALRHRNYRLFFLGQGVSLIGTWLTTTATSWLVLRLALASPGWLTVATTLGVVRFAAQAPMAALAPLAGVWIDRWNRHHVLVFTQALSLVESAVLAVLTFTGRINIGTVVALNIFQGLINALDAPARQAFVVELIEDPADLPNAIALNSTMFNGARLLGPAIAGLLIASFGEGWCFTVDAVSYLAVLVALLRMTLRPRLSNTGVHNVWHELREGFAFAAGFAPARALLLLAGLVSFMTSAFLTLLPIFADAVAPPGHGAELFGFLGAATGVGALAGAVYLASRRSVHGLGQIIALAAMLAGVALVAFASTTSLPLMYGAAIAAGFGMIITFASCNTVLQTLVDDELRGRVMAFFIVAVMGAAPLGGLVAGWVAGFVGGPVTVLAAGLACVAGAIVFLIKLPLIRAIVLPILARKGILPEVASGLQAADRLHTADES